LKHSLTVFGELVATALCRRAVRGLTPQQRPDTARRLQHLQDPFLAGHRSASLCCRNRGRSDDGAGERNL